MPSLVELIFTAVGSDTVAREIAKVNGGLGEMVGSLGRMATTALSVDYAWNKVSDAIGDAANFQRLSLRIGETVRETVILDQAFRNAGLGAEMIGTSANMLERALGGVNDVGAKTDTAFRRIGTSIAELKPLTYAEQLGVLSKGFAELGNQSEKVAVARQLFGRGGGQMLQLLGDPDAMTRSRDQAEAVAVQIEHNADAAVKLQQAWNGLTANSRLLWQSVAGQLMPALTKMTELFNRGDAAGTGGFLGTVGPAALIAPIGLAITALFQKMDVAALNWEERLTKRFGDGFRAQIAGNVSDFTGVLATALPYGLAAALALQIVAGLMQARESSEWQALLLDIARTKEARAAAQKKVGGVDSAEGAAKTATELNTEIAELEKQRDALAKKIAAAPDYVKGATTAAARDNSVIAAMAHFILATDDRYQGSYANDRVALTGLAERITALRAARGKVATPEAAAATIADNALTALKDSLAPLVAQIPQLQQKVDEQRLKEKSPLDQTIALQTRRRTLEAQIDNVPEGLDADEAKARRLKLEEELLKVQAQEHEAAQRLGEQLKQHADEVQRRVVYELETQREVALAAGDTELAQSLKEQVEETRARYELNTADFDLAKQRAAAEHAIFEEDQRRALAKRQIDDERTALEDYVGQLREQVADLQSDYNHTAAEKYAAQKNALLTEVRALQQEESRLRSRAEEANEQGRPELANKFLVSARGVAGQRLGSEHELARLGPDPNNPFQQMRASLTALRSEWGTTAEQIGHGIKNVIGGAVQSISQNITGMLTGTESLRQGFARIGLAIEESVIGALVDMGVKYIATKLIMAATDKSMAAASLVALIPIAMAQSALWSAPATLATIASFGGAAAAAPFEIGAAMLVTQGLALASEGGFFPGDPTKARGIFHGDEVVITAPAVRRFGAENLVAFNTAAKSGGPAPSFAGGGAAAAASRSPNIHLYFDKAAWMRAVAGDVEGIAHAVYETRDRKG